MSSREKLINESVENYGKLKALTGKMTPLNSRFSVKTGVERSSEQKRIHQEINKTLVKIGETLINLIVYHDYPTEALEDFFNDNIFNKRRELKMKLWEAMLKEILSRKMTEEESLRGLLHLADNFDSSLRERGEKPRYKGMILEIIVRGMDKDLMLHIGASGYKNQEWQLVMKKIKENNWEEELEAYRFMVKRNSVLKPRDRAV